MTSDKAQLLTCLVVDDNYDLFPIIQISLAENFLCSYAPDSFTAHQQLTAQHFDILLCDIHMPHLDGFGFIEELRKKMISTPVIFISGMMDDEAVRQAFRLGAANVISKPFDMEELRDKCELVIKMRGTVFNEPPGASEQELGYIYNLLKTYYYDIEGIMHQIHLYKIPLEVVRDELDKKQRIGRCHLDNPESIKFLSKVA